MKQRIIRHKRIRAKIKGTAERPRFSVFKSNRHFFIQLIDDGAQKTLISVSDKEIKSKSKSRKIIAREIGKTLAKKALGRDVKKIVFDRGGYKFHGVISELAEGAREGGLKF